MYEISCNNCTAACCQRNTAFALDSNELAFMEDGGNVYRTLLPADPNIDWSKRRERARIGNEILKNVTRQLRPGQGYFVLKSEVCTFLTEDDKCSLYDNPSRPGNCQTFRSGSLLCQKLRSEHNVPDVKIQLTPKPIIIAL